MVVTEILLVSYSQDPKLQEELKQKAPELFRHFLGVNGLQSLSRGKVVDDNGTSVDSGSGRSALILGSLVSISEGWSMLTEFIDRVGQQILFSRLFSQFSGLPGICWHDEAIRFFSCSA